MVLDSRITWEKIKIELELLSKEEPQSLLPLMTAINSLLRGDNFQDWCSRNINFMSFELSANCSSMQESERLKALNEFFFQDKDYSIRESRRPHLTDRDLFLRDVLSERNGGSLPIALIYMHLAFHLNLPMMLVNIDSLCLVRWLCSDSRSYIDLTQNGQIIGEEELLKYLNTERSVRGLEGQTEKLEVLNFKQVMTVYLEDLASCLARSNEPDLVHAVLSMLLILQPNNLKYLSDRALLRKSLGFQKEALSDIKRYFSFCDMENAPSDIQTAFKEITAFHKIDAPETLH